MFWGKGAVGKKGIGTFPYEKWKQIYLIVPSTIQTEVNVHTFINYIIRTFSGSKDWINKI